MQLTILLHNNICYQADIKQEYPTHSMDIFLHAWQEMVDEYKARVRKDMPKVEPHMITRAKFIELVIKKWESDGVSKQKQLTKMQNGKN